MRIFVAILVAASSLIAAAPARAQTLPVDQAAALRAEIAALKAQLATMEQRLDRVDVAPVNSADAPPLPTQPAAETPTIAFKGAPEITTKNGWSFKPRGRVHVDLGYVDAPNGVDRAELGLGAGIRRARLGVEGKIPGGFGYRAELDFATGAEIVDAYVNYTNGGFVVTVGQHNNFQSLEELTSSNFTSFMERAAFTDAFNFERRVGASASYAAGDLLIAGGVFADNATSFTIGNDQNASVDGRLIWMPKFGSTQAHVGGSVHYRDLGDAVSSVRYRERPFVRTTDIRFVDTGTISATDETGLGVEAAFVAGRVHGAAEAYRQTVSRPDFADPDFFGGYAELGWFLTKGDTRAYRRGAFDRTVPTNGFDKGGWGALQLVARYDRIDLDSASVAGGTQDAFGLSLIWNPTAYTRLMANYGRLLVNGSVVSNDGDTGYGIDAFGMRAQVDF